MKHPVTRCIGVMVLALAVAPAVTFAATVVTSAIEVFHDPACGWCVNGIRLQVQGYTVTSHEEPSMARSRRNWACLPTPRLVTPRPSVAT